MNIAAFTGGINIPSARFRLRQYVEPLKEHNILINEFNSFFGCYPPSQKIFRPAWGIASLIDRIPAIIKSYNYDLIILQREFISTYFTIEGLTKSPRILDVDDAIWLNGGRGHAEKLASTCELIVCGNDFLAEHFSKWNRNVTVIPTPVDTKRYQARSTESDNRKENRFIIGWSGSYSGSTYLLEIEPALNIFMRTHSNVVLRIISDNFPKFSLLPLERVEFIKWSPSNEVTSLQDLDVGIMPLKESSFERGKCSYKMLTYMACQIPVIVSDFGMNSDVLKLGDIGIGVRDQNSWIDALENTIKNPERAKFQGEVGRKVIEQHYSVDKLKNKWIQLLNTM